MLGGDRFIAREEGDEFLVLTCPECSKSLIFTQRADLVVIRVATDTHANRCPGKTYPPRPRTAEVVVAAR